MENTNTTIDLTEPSRIENIDFAFYEWFDSELNIFTDTNSGWKKVPIIWVSPERAYQIKNNKEFRDINGAINPPAITIERTNIVKDQKESGVYFANLPPINNRHNIGRRINQKKTSEFANADSKKKAGGVNFLRAKKKNNKVVYQFKEMLLPVYASFTYNVEIMTQYQQQMNQILQVFIAKTGSTKYFLIERDGYKYECFIDGNINSKNNLANMENEERKYISSISIRVLANLIGEGDNDPKTVIKTYENPVELKLNRDKLGIIPNVTYIGSEIGAGRPTAPQTIYTGNNVSTTSPTLRQKEFIITADSSNTFDGATRVYHYFNNRSVNVDIFEYDGDIVSVINTDVNLYDNYVEAYLIEGDQYLFVITG